MLFRSLNDKGKLQYIEGDYNTGDNSGEMVDISKTKDEHTGEDRSDDDQFIGSIPPAYKGIIKTWKQRQPEVSNGIDDIIGDKLLPLYLLANRRALLETLKLIYKHAALLNEKTSRNNSTLVIEKWQRLAGLLK